MLRIVTDGAADFPAGWEEEFDIQIVPINIHFGEETFLQYIEMNLEEFYHKIDTGSVFPKTSQPSPHQFSEFYKTVAEEGDAILSIHVTSKLSGTYASAVAASDDLRGKYDVIPFDSAGGSLGIAFMCRAARQMERAGKSIEEILTRLESMRERIQIILTLDNLEYARRSGRVGTLSAALASLLNVKPIAVLKDGILNMVEKVRTRKAALDRVLEMGKEAFGDNPVHLGVVHARDPKAGASLLEAAKKRFNYKDAVYSDLSVSLAINLGPGTVGLVLCPVE
ncbi:MAG: DegV family protein [Anaerolineales bacterium]|jgi:DegV family protein with EDD domain